MKLDDRCLTPERVMINRFSQYSKPNWKVAILCFNNFLSCEVITNFFKAIPLKGYKIFYGIDSNETERQVFEATVAGNQIGIITRLSWGGPQAAILVEELSQLGVQYIIGYGAAGSIDKKLQKGDLVFGGNSLISDGTSRAYLQNQRTVDCDEDLLSILREVAQAISCRITEVTVANVDALYRETKELITQFQHEGAQIVNLETSALYASSKVCNTKSIWLGFISDSLVQENWDSWDVDPTKLSYELSHICAKMIDKLFESNVL